MLLAFIADLICRWFPTERPQSEWEVRRGGIPKAGTKKRNR